MWFEVCFIVSLALGLAGWYVLYGLECFFNGGTGGCELPFLCLWDDIRFNTPGGWRRRLEATGGDEEWARELPGLGHVLFMHVLVPFGLCAFVLLVWN